MDEKTAAKARARKGVVVGAELGGHPGRTAARSSLRPVRPGAYVAETQPLDVPVLLAAVKLTAGDRLWVVMGAGALWLYGFRACPDQLVLGVPLGHKLAVVSEVTVRRVADAVLTGHRPRGGCRVVALEIAVIQVAAKRPAAEVRQLVEELVRGRHTTLARLRARCRKGLSGSARVRAVCDELAGGSMDADVRRLKAALEARGVEGLEPEVRFTNAAGASAYADLLHRPTVTVIEVDGFVEHTRRERFRADRRRDRWLRAQHGVLTLRVDVLEIREDLDALVDDLVWFLQPPSSSSAA